MPGDERVITLVNVVAEFRLRLSVIERNAPAGGKWGGKKLAEGQILRTKARATTTSLSSIRVVECESTIL